MSDSVTTHDSTERRAADAFEHWRQLSHRGVAHETTLGDWIVTPYREAVCFQRAGEHDVYMVLEHSVVHFGLDHDTFESAYSLGTRHLHPSVSSRTHLVRRYLSQRRVSGE